MSFYYWWLTGPDFTVKENFATDFIECKIKFISLEKEPFCICHACIFLKHYDGDICILLWRKDWIYKAMYFSKDLFVYRISKTGLSSLYCFILFLILFLVSAATGSRRSHLLCSHAIPMKMSHKFIVWPATILHTDVPQVLRAVIWVSQCEMQCSSQVRHRLCFPTPVGE